MSHRRHHSASPLIRLHANDNVLIARQPIAPRPGAARVRPAHARAGAGRPQDRRAAHRRRRAGQEVRHRDRRRDARHRGRRARALAQPRAGRLRPRPGLLRGRAPGRLRARGRARHLHGHRAARRPRRDAQLHRHPVVGQLLGHGRSSTSPRTSRPSGWPPIPNVDGVVAFAQTSGCGMSSPSEHFDVLRRTIAGYARHPNLAGVLIVGLGCERNQVADLVESQGLEARRQRCARW